MEEPLEKVSNIPEETEAASPLNEELPREDSERADETVDEAPAEMSLEGRKAQLEEKISAEIDRQPEPAPQPLNQAASDAAIGQQYVSVYNAPALAPQGRVKASRPNAMPSGAKAYMILITGLAVVFLIGFVIECGRTFHSTGLFGGDLDRFLESDPFGDDEDEDTDATNTPFGGIFPFDFGDDDTDENDSDSIDDSDSDLLPPLDSDVETKKMAQAPDSESVIDPGAANLSAKDQPKDIDSADYTARKAYKKVENSVVNVVVYTSPDYVGDESYRDGTGSGIIVSSDGYIITNSHVINDSKNMGVEIITTSGDSYVATVVGFDPRTDLAVLKINADSLTAVEFVNSDQIEVGQDAIAVGNPGGMAYSNSLTRGCVSALNRTVPTNTMVSYIQTDAAINPGNSGGPLLNSAGQVMGITTVKIANTDYEGMGFAIPANTVIEIANNLISTGYVSGRVRLGVMAGRYDDPVNNIKGLQIKSINDDSPFKNTEVREEDIIVRINGESTPTIPALYSILAEYNPGDKVTVTLYREPSVGSAGKTFSVEIELLADEGIS